MRTFRLYPEERHFWSFNDYGAVLAVVERLQAKTILEFGPGSSTLALVEGGATSIDTCEDDPAWALVYEQRLVPRFPDVIALHQYQWSSPIQIPAIAERRYDLALIDGPHAATRRVPVLNFALERCASILMPVDDSRGLQKRLDELSKKPQLVIERFETGPLAGSFVLISRTAKAQGAQR